MGTGRGGDGNQERRELELLNLSPASSFPPLYTQEVFYNWVDTGIYYV